jgi:hypothetical protein
VLANVILPGDHEWSGRAVRHASAIELGESATQRDGLETKAYELGL